MPTLYVVGIVIAVIIFLCIFVTVCYKKAPPTEAIVITGLGHREPKVVCGKGAFVIPFVQRADTLDMRIMKCQLKMEQQQVVSSTTSESRSATSTNRRLKIPPLKRNIESRYSSSAWKLRFLFLIFSAGTATTSLEMQTTTPSRRNYIHRLGVASRRASASWCIIAVRTFLVSVRR